MKISKHIQSQMHKVAKLNAEANSIMREIEDYLLKKGIDPDLMRGLSNDKTFREYSSYLTDLDGGEDVTDDFVAFLEREYKDF